MILHDGLCMITCCFLPCQSPDWLLYIFPYLNFSLVNVLLFSVYFHQISKCWFIDFKKGSIIILCLCHFLGLGNRSGVGHTTYLNFACDRAEKKINTQMLLHDVKAFIIIHTWNSGLNFINSHKSATVRLYFKVWWISHVWKPIQIEENLKGLAVTLPCDGLSLVTCGHPITKASPFIGDLNEARVRGECACCEKKHTQTQFHINENQVNMCTTLFSWDGEQKEKSEKIKIHYERNKKLKCKKKKNWPDSSL